LSVAPTIGIVTDVEEYTRHRVDGRRYSVGWVVTFAVLIGLAVGVWAAVALKALGVIG
jgi:hypothetical protein